MLTTLAGASRNLSVPRGVKELGFSRFTVAVRTTLARTLRRDRVPRGFRKAAAASPELDSISISSNTTDYKGKLTGRRSDVDRGLQSLLSLDIHTKVETLNPTKGVSKVETINPDTGGTSREISSKEEQRGTRPESSPLEMNSARHMKVDISNLKDELAFLDAKPLLRAKNGRSLARLSAEGSNEEKRPLARAQPATRRALTEPVGFVPPKRQHSFREDVHHVASETFLITRLAIRLLRYLGVGYRWITKLLALGLYAIFLMPGFVQIGYQYFFSKNIYRSIVYGEQPRNRLDLYLPEDTSSQKPVVIFVTGGAWTIGYKAWGALLGIQLSQRDIMVCCIDYRNFPQGGVSDMVEDVTGGIGYVVNNIDQYGGDPDRIYLAGQSAGSHLAACALVEQARIEIGQKEGIMTWKTGQIKAFLGLSGGYDLLKLTPHFHKRGLYKSLFLSIMEGETSLPLYSPELAVQSEAFVPAIPLLPPIYLFHGTADYSIPHEASERFAAVLNRVGARATLHLYSDKTHTDVFLQDPMRGGQDDLFEEVVRIIHEDDEEATARDMEAPVRPRLVPEFLLSLAHKISPF